MIKPKLILRPSRILAGLLLFIHGGAITCLAFINMPWWAHLALVAIIIVSLVISFRQYVMLRGAKTVIKVSEENNHWQLQTRDGTVWRAQIRGDSVVTNFLVVLNFNVKNKRKTVSVAVFSDTLSTSDFRNLRVRLIALKNQFSRKK